MSIPNINLDAEIADFKERCAPWFQTEVTDDNCAQVRDMIKEAGDIEAKIESGRKADKAPHIEAGKAIDAAAQTLAAPIVKAKDFLRKRLTEFAQAIERKRQAEAEAARQAAENARRAAEEQAAKEATPDPFAAFDAAQAEEKAQEAQAVAQERVQIASREGNARALSLKIVGWIVTVTDPAALVAHFAGHPDVIEAARKVAASQARAAKGATPIPGVKIEPDRKAA